MGRVDVPASGAHRQDERGGAVDERVTSKFNHKAVSGNRNRRGGAAWK
jgi:hypothetical protein